MTRAIIKIETGEILKEISDSEIVKIYQRTSLERRKISKKLFFKLYHDTLQIFSNMNIHSSVFITFFKLIKFMTFDNEFLSLNGLLLNLKRISEICEIKMPTLKNHVKKLEKLEMLKRIKNGRDVNILINPYFIGYGKDNTDIALITFSKTKWAKNPKL